MKPKVYIETTIVSYLAAGPNRNVIVAGHQQTTHDWWELRKDGFELYSSQMVATEAGRGDASLANRRLELLKSLPVLDTNDEARALARALIERGPTPREEPEDALHIAVATVHGMHFLLTWNCTHIANAQMQLALYETCLSEGFELPRICTPTELMGEDYHVEG